MKVSKDIVRAGVAPLGHGVVTDGDVPVVALDVALQGDETHVEAR